MEEKVENLEKEALMKNLLNLYQQHRAFPNPVVKEYIERLENKLADELRPCKCKCKSK